MAGKTVTVGGHTLRFDFNATCDIEEELGTGIWEQLESGKVPASFRIVRGIFWAGLHTHDRTIDIVQAGEILQNLLETMGLQEIGESLMDGLDSQFPDQKPGGAATGKPPAG